MEGRFLWTLVATDMATGWSECLPLLNRDGASVMAALRMLEELLPSSSPRTRRTAAGAQPAQGCPPDRCCAGGTAAQQRSGGPAGNGSLLPGLPGQPLGRARKPRAKTQDRGGGS